MFLSFTADCNKLKKKVSVWEGMNLVFLCVSTTFSLFAIIFGSDFWPSDRMYFFLPFEVSGSAT